MLKIKHKLNSNSQAGFGISEFILIILILTIISGLAYSVYKRSQTTHSERTITNEDQETDGSGRDNYIFSPVTIDTSDWYEFEPFQGFKVKLPGSWVIVHDSSGFNRPITGGKINEDGSPNYTYGEPQKTTFLDSPDLRRNELNSIIEGAEIKTYMTVQENDLEKQKNPCDQAYLNRQPELIELEKFVTCKVKVSKYGYDFTVNSARMRYRLSVIYNPGYTDQLKDEYNSIGLEMVKSFTLY